MQKPTIDEERERVYVRGEQKKNGDEIIKSRTIFKQTKNLLLFSVVSVEKICHLVFVKIYVSKPFLV